MVVDTSLFRVGGRGARIACLCACVCCSWQGSAGQASLAPFGAPHLSFGRSGCLLCLLSPLLGCRCPAGVFVGFFVLFFLCLRVRLCAFLYPVRCLYQPGVPLALARPCLLLPSCLWFIVSFLPSLIFCLLSCLLLRASLATAFRGCSSVFVFGCVALGLACFSVCLPPPPDHVLSCVRRGAVFFGLLH